MNKNNITNQYLHPISTKVLLDYLQGNVSDEERKGLEGTFENYPEYYDALEGLEAMYLTYEEDTLEYLTEVTESIDLEELLEDEELLPKGQTVSLNLANHLFGSTSTVFNKISIQQDSIEELETVSERLHETLKIAEDLQKAANRFGNIRTLIKRLDKIYTLVDGLDSKYEAVNSRLQHIEDTTKLLQEQLNSESNESDLSDITATVDFASGLAQSFSGSYGKQTNLDGWLCHDMPDNIGNTDNLIIYFSGHGHNSELTKLEEVGASGKTTFLQYFKETLSKAKVGVLNSEAILGPCFVGNPASNIDNIFQNQSDGQLLKQLTDTKDNKAASVLYQRYYHNSFNYLFNFLKDDKESAAEIYNSVFIKVLNNIQKEGEYFKVKGSFRNYLFKSLKNQCFQYVNRKSKQLDEKKEGLKLNSLPDIGNNFNYGNFYFGQYENKIKPFTLTLGDGNLKSSLNFGKAYSNLDKMNFYNSSKAHFYIDAICYEAVEKEKLLRNEYDNPLLFFGNQEIKKTKSELEIIFMLCCCFGITLVRSLNLIGDEDKKSLIKEDLKSEKGFSK